MLPAMWASNIHIPIIGWTPWPRGMWPPELDHLDVVPETNLHSNRMFTNHFANLTCQFGVWIFLVENKPTDIHLWWNSCLQQPCLKTASHHLYLVNLDEFGTFGWLEIIHHLWCMKTFSTGGKEERPMDKKFWDVIFQLARVVRGKNSDFREPLWKNSSIRFIPAQPIAMLEYMNCLRKKLGLCQLYSKLQASILRHSQFTSGESMASSDVICCSDLGTTRWPMYSPWGTAGIPLWMPKGITPNMTTWLAFGSPYPQSRSPDCFDIASWVSPPCPIIQRRPFKNCL